MELVSGTARVIAVGEAMLELTRQGEHCRLGHGGDTLNTAVHWARLGLNSGYLTALGDDPLSDTLRGRLECEDLDTSLILKDANRPTGIYAVTTDNSGERSFIYWRRESAASAMTTHPGFAAAAEQCVGADLLAFSLISLAILPETERHILLDLVRRVREGGCKIAFDGNFRPRLWDDLTAARYWRDAAAAVADFGFPTLDDERALGGFEDPAAVAAHWRAAGTGEVVVKLGAAGCLLDDGRAVEPFDAIEPVDTSGAGDAFNAGYLAARLGGADPAIAAARANRLAGWVISRVGALPPKDPLAPYPAFVARSQIHPG